jgi:para-nitrobenzyl esterase
MTDSVVVKTSRGALRGERTADSIEVFRGIPFAAPPVGALRYRPPAPATAWDGVRDATRFGPAAMQGARQAPTGGVFAGAFGPSDLGISEDCLTLNVWTPAADGAKRPVMVWIHGGAFRMGTGASPGYDGSTLVRRGDVVVVTLNYRLGVLGFLHQPEIGSVNLGLLDQVAALKWVASEIEAFGGDPDQVTIFGESAGGKSVECLLTMPSAAGLFRRAIAQSTYAPPMDPAASAARAEALVARLGLESPEGLRHVDADALLQADVELMMANPGGATGGAGPVVDGDVLPTATVEALAAGRARGVPLLIGTTLDEARLFGAFAGGGGAAAGDIGPDELVALYRKDLAERGEPNEPADIQSAISTDRMFRQHSIRVAATQSAPQPATYMYLFGWKSQGYEGRLGACHGIELPFVFGTHDAPMGLLAGNSEEARELGLAVQDAWLSFAKTGRPTSDRLPQWPPYNTDDRSTMVLDRESRVEQAPMEAIRLWWEGRL